MKWFKHDTDAMQDAKIERLLMRHGVVGYGVYFAVVELIASNISPTKTDFRLEHDAEILAYRLRLEPEKIEQILSDCVELNLFERTDDGYITCFKLASRLDNTMAQNKQIKQVTMELFDSETEEKIENNSNTPDCPHQKILDSYHEHCPQLPTVRIMSDKRKKMLKARWRESEKHQNIDFWERYFKFVSESPFLCGENDRKWNADFEWLINSSNFVKVIEGKYHGK